MGGSLPSTHDQPHGRADVDAWAVQLLPWGVLVADDTGRIVMMNEAARVLLGVGDDGLRGVAVSCDGEPVCLADLVRAHAAGPDVRTRLDVVHAEHGRLRATLTRMTGGELPGVHLLVEHAPRGDWQWSGRANPLAAFAHEFRNALTSLCEGLALLNEGAAGPLSATQRRLFDPVRRDAERMCRLTDDMLDVSRARAGRTRCATSWVDLADLARDVARSFGAAATRNGVDLRLGELHPGARCNVDRDPFAQALHNLVHNALKFTPTGGWVSISVRRAAADDQEVVDVEVRDTGPGLSEQEIEELLSGDRSGGRNSLARGRSGLGIGLSITREIAEHHGGEFSISGEPGVGSCFRIRIPMNPRHSQHRRLAHVDRSIRIAKAVGAPLAVVELGLFAVADGAALWSNASGLAQLPLVEQCLYESLRPSDLVLVGQRSITLVLYSADGPCAQRVAERAIGALRRLFKRLPSDQPPFRVALGVGSFPDDGSTAAGVVAAAERRMRRHRAEPLEPPTARAAAEAPPAADGLSVPAAAPRLIMAGQEDCPR